MVTRTTTMKVMKTDRMKRETTISRISPATLYV